MATYWTPHTERADFIVLRRDDCGMSLQVSPNDELSIGTSSPCVQPDPSWTPFAS